MKVLLSSGYGRLHLAQTAFWLARAGVHVFLACGWVPRKSNGVLVRLCSAIVGRNLSAGMKKRAVDLGTEGKILAGPFVDFLCQFLYCAERLIFRGRFHGIVASLAWKMFGWHCRRYIRWLAREKDCLFHVRSGAGHGGAIQLARKMNIPVVVDHSIAHPEYMEQHLREEYEKNNATFELGTTSPFWRLVIEDCEWADILLVNSYFVRDTFLSHGYSAEKIRVVYLGTRSDFFGIRNVSARGRGDQPLRLLFTGNFCFRKGAQYFLEAILFLKEHGHNNFIVDVVGSYDESKELIEKYSKYNLPITFHGPVPQDELKLFLAKADIYVFPSLAEGCACSGMEAMAAGLCVVGTHEAGFPIEDGVNGCIVPAGDANALAEKIIWLLRNPDKIDTMGNAAAELIRSKYTWEQYAANVKTIYEELLSRGKD